MARFGDAENDIAHRAATGQDFIEQARDYVERGILTGKDVNAAAKRAHIDPLIRRVTGMGPEDALKVWKTADDAEKAKLRPLMARKLAIVLSRPKVEREELLPQFQEALQR